ncbi:unnamed protein product [Closterium sp. NIES-54]
MSSIGPLGSSREKQSLRSFSAPPDLLPALTPLSVHPSAPPPRFPPIARTIFAAFTDPAFEASHKPTPSRTAFPSSTSSASQPSKWIDGHVSNSNDYIPGAAVYNLRNLKNATCGAGGGGYDRRYGGKQQARGYAQQAGGGRPRTPMAVPFQVTPEEARALLREHLTGHLLAPAIADVDSSVALSAVFQPFWTFAADGGCMGVGGEWGRGCGVG